MRYLKKLNYYLIKKTMKNKPIRKIKNIIYNYYGDVLYINIHKDELQDLICNDLGITTFKIDPRW
jgi:hypothetical protein